MQSVNLRCHSYLYSEQIEFKNNLSTLRYMVIRSAQYQLSDIDNALFQQTSYFTKISKHTNNGKDYYL